MTTPPDPHRHPVIVDRHGGVATLTLNRPDAMNALDVATKESLLTLLRQVADDPAVRCVVLRGSGRAFCVGQDLNEHIEVLTADLSTAHRTVEEHYNPIVTLIATMNKPVIAALNGVAAGAGAALAFAADLRVMADDSALNLAFSAIGLSCDTGTSWTLPRLIGTAKAKELLFFPRTLQPAECLELGLVNRVVASDELDNVVNELAQRLAAGPTLAYGAIRQAVTFAEGHDLPAALTAEIGHMQATGTSADHRAAVEAFLAKRKPEFHGR